MFTQTNRELVYFRGKLCLFNDATLIRQVFGLHFFITLLLPLRSPSHSSSRSDSSLRRCVYIVFPRLRNGPFSGFVIGTGPSRGSVSVYRVVIIIKKSRSHQKEKNKKKTTAALGFSSPPTQPVPTHCLDREGRRY